MRLGSAYEQHTAAIRLFSETYVDQSELLRLGREQFGALLNAKLNELLLGMAKGLAADRVTWEHIHAAFEGALLGVRYKVLLG